MNIVLIIVVIIVILSIIYIYCNNKNNSIPISNLINTRIDSNTSIDDINKYNKDGMQLIYSNEMKDMNRIKQDFVFEEQPLGTLGTGDQNYTGDKLVKLTNNGLYLGINNNSDIVNGIFDNRQWDSTKMTGRTNIRYCYGTIECKLRCPDLVGAWPAFWLNFCSGNYTPDSKGVMSLQGYLPDHPFPCNMFWPPEIDIMERFSPGIDDDKLKILKSKNINVSGEYNQNQSSLHSPNQYTGPPVDNVNTNQWCPCGLCDSAGPNEGPVTDTNKCSERKPGNGWCFGTSLFFRDLKKKHASKSFIVYKCTWTPEKVEFYMDDIFYGSIDYRTMAFYQNGSVGPVVIPSVPMFPIFNTSIMGFQNLGKQDSRLGITSFLNFDDKNQFKKDGIEIEWLRIYQDKNGSGLNPKITDTQRQTIMSTKSGVSRHSEVSNVGQIFTPNSTLEEQLDLSNKVVNNVCKHLTDLGDNFCLGMDSAMVANNGGVFGSPLPIQKAEAVLAYSSDKYNLKCNAKDCQKLNYNVMPPEFAQSDWYNKYGNPEHDLSPKAPCSGQQTVDGKNISQYKCV